MVGRVHLGQVSYIGYIGYIGCRGDGVDGAGGWDSSGGYGEAVGGEPAFHGFGGVCRA
jgi:hypothetical protein